MCVFKKKKIMQKYINLTAENENFDRQQKNTFINGNYKGKKRIFT